MGVEAREVTEGVFAGCPTEGFREERSATGVAYFFRMYGTITGDITSSGVRTPELLYSTSQFCGFFHTSDADSPRHRN